MNTTFIETKASLIPPTTQRQAANEIKPIQMLFRCCNYTNIWTQDGGGGHQLTWTICKMRLFPGNHQDRYCKL